MIKHTDPYQVSQIFSNEKVILYKIPKYQREYTWGPKEWNLLFNDIIENENGYFLGSIICVDKSKSAMNDVELEVIDGQQRITSLSLLLVALYDKLSKYKAKFDDDQFTDLNNIKRELVIKRDNEMYARLTPQVQGNNRSDYFSLLCEKGLLVNKEKKSFAGLRKMYKGFYHFSNMIDKHLEEILEEVPEEELENEKIKALFGLTRKFNSAILVSIEVETNKDAYMLFESLNNRGIPLSAIDLIKNLLISISDQDGKAEECHAKWEKIINNYLTDDYSVQERFFRQFYNAYREELNKPFPTGGKTKYALGYLATRTTLLDIYEKLLKNGYEEFLDRLLYEAKNYAILINNVDEDTKNEVLYDSLLNLERIQGAPAYILLLYIMSNKESLELNDKIIKEIIDFLVKFFVRRNITDYPNTRNLTKIFMDAVSLISDKKGEEIYELIKVFLINNSSSDEEFEKKLNGGLYIDNPEATRFLLCYYENRFMTSERYTDLWKRDNSNKYVWTIEHIFPEGNNIPDSWVNMIADGNRELANEYLNKYVHTLGNLTITGYNQTLSNLSFIEKKDRKKDGKFVGYRNGLTLNEDVVSEEEWKIDNINNRTKKLVDYFVEEFKL